MDKPFISVIMGFHNSGEYLKTSIESILNQTYSNFELILIDDCSTDNSYFVAKLYESKDKRVRLLQNSKNMGLTATLNRGINAASGEFIARMDDDDISVETRFEKQLNFILSNNIDVVGSNCINIDSFGNKTGCRKYPEKDKDIKKVLPIYNPICHPSVMIKKKTVFDTGLYNEKFKTTQDYELWFRMTAFNATFHNIQEPLLLYRESRSVNKRKTFKYRLNDIKVRIAGYRYIKLPFYKWVYLFIPFILGIVPMRFFKLLKKIDPRNG